MVPFFVYRRLWVVLVVGFVYGFPVIPDGAVTREVD